MSLEKEKETFLCCVHLLRKDFYVAVLQRWLKNVQKKHDARSCCFTNINLTLFCRSRCRRRRCCLSSLLCCHQKNLQRW